MKATCLLVLAIAAGSAFSGASAATTSFRCKNDLVNVGDSKASALLKCGEPVVKDSFCKSVDPKTVAAPKGRSAVAVVTPCETVDEWTYNPGYGQFMTTLRFESGKLVSITYGDRVK
jgi:hypothetical protein